MEIFLFLSLIAIKNIYNNLIVVNFNELHNHALKCLQWITSCNPHYSCKLDFIEQRKLTQTEFF